MVVACTPHKVHTSILWHAPVLDLQGAVRGHAYRCALAGDLSHVDRVLTRVLSIGSHIGNHLRSGGRQRATVNRSQSAMQCVAQVRERRNRKNNVRVSQVKERCPFARWMPEYSGLTTTLSA